MKNVLIALAIAGSSLTVVAGEIVAYNSQTVAVLEATAHCARELAELSKDGLVESATTESAEDRDVYTLNFAAGGYAPSFKTYSVGTLTITKTFVRSTITAPDAPGGAFEYSCSVTK